MHRLRCLVVIGALAVAVSVVGAGPAFAAKGGNNDAANLCQHGGWRAFGTLFANQGDCVNDGAKGSAPFGTAGKAACDGIGGTFTSDATSWSCSYDTNFSGLPENPPALQTACNADRGMLDTSAIAPGEFIAMCRPLPRPPI